MSLSADCHAVAVVQGVHEVFLQFEKFITKANEWTGVEIVQNEE